MTSRVSLKEKNRVKRQQLNEIQYHLDVYEKENCGQFEQIFPIDLTNYNLDKIKAIGDTTKTEEQKEEIIRICSEMEQKARIIDEIYAVAGDTE